MISVVLRQIPFPISDRGVCPGGDCPGGDCPGIFQMFKRSVINETVVWVVNY